jgi:hypothetical protein
MAREGIDDVNFLELGVVYRSLEDLTHDISRIRIGVVTG